MTEFNTMVREDVKAGRRFFHKDDHCSSEFSFRKQFGKQLVLVKSNNTKIGLITNISNVSFSLSTWFFNQEVTIIVPFSELLIIEPK